MVQAIQLDLLPMAYYNTLGFDKELIDYIDFVDDSIVYEIIAPLYKDGGRPPKQPISQFRAHYLYFTKPEITSYRHLERVLKNPKNQDYRNFIAAPSTKDVPSHNCMSDFRKKVGVERFYQIMFRFIAQALKVDGFIDTNLTSIDSRPLYANTAGPKRKGCDCQDKKSCNCPKYYLKVLPENVTEDLKVLCQADRQLIWDGFDKKELVSWYKGNQEYCQGCLFSATCEQSFAFSYKENPFIFSPVPQGTELHKAMQKFRKQVELNFGMNY